jgi:hypothetical protein
MSVYEREHVLLELQSRDEFNYKDIFRLKQRRDSGVEYPDWFFDKKETKKKMKRNSTIGTG